MDKERQNFYSVPMAKVSIKKDSPLNQTETFSRLKTVLDKDSDLRKLDPDYQCQFDEQAKTGSAKGSKFDASLSKIASFTLAF
jgi:hypothetical protein